MPVRRGAARLAALLTLVTGLVVTGLLATGAPAAAADDTVVLRLPSRFTAGGSAGSVSVSVAKRTDGCVSVRTTLAIRLRQLPVDQVRVEVSRDGRWRAVGVSDAGGGLVVTERVAPDRDRLCRKRSVSVRYRVTFLAGAPGGAATLTAEAYTGAGALIDRAAGTRTVVNRTGVVVPTPLVSEVPTPTPESVDPVGQLAPPVAAPPQQGQDGGFSGLGALVMALGLVMVGVGIALLVLLVRRSRADRDQLPVPPYVLPKRAARHRGRGGPSPASPPGDDGDPPTLLIPRVPY